MAPFFEGHSNVKGASSRRVRDVKFQRECCHGSNPQYGLLFEGSACSQEKNVHDTLGDGTQDEPLVGNTRKSLAMSVCLRGDGVVSSHDPGKFPQSLFPHPPSPSPSNPWRTEATGTERTELALVLARSVNISTATHTTTTSLFIQILLGPADIYHHRYHSLQAQLFLYH